MPVLPPPIAAQLAPFAPLFSGRVWGNAQVLLAGALLAPAQRTVAAALRATGRADAPQFHRYHRVLSHARWSGLAVGRGLLALLVAAFAPDGPLVFGIDETLERRRGKRIVAKGIYRDAVRSSKDFFVKASGLRWACLMLLVPIPWAGRTWALPVLTALAPSERYDLEHGRRHKALTDWARQLLRVARRWWPERAIVAVADSGYAALAFLAACRAWRKPVTVVTRLRLDAALYAPAPPRRPRQNGRPRLKGARLPTLAAIAAAPETAWVEVTVARWYGAGERQVEVVTDTAVWYHTGLPPVPLRRGTRVRVADPRPGRQVRRPGPALHRPGGHARADPGVVRAALAAGGDAGGGTPPPRRRVAAPMVRPGDPPHHPGAARPFLARRPARPRAHGRPRPGHPPGRVVSQGAPHLRRRPGAGPARVVAA